MKSNALDDDILHVRGVIKEKHVNLVGRNEERKQLTEHFFSFACSFVLFSLFELLLISTSPQTNGGSTPFPCPCVIIQQPSPNPPSYPEIILFWCLCVQDSEVRHEHG